MEEPSLSVSRALLDDAREAGLDVSAIAEGAIAQALDGHPDPRTKPEWKTLSFSEKRARVEAQPSTVRRARADRARRDAATSIELWNEYVEENGLPLASVRAG